MRATTKLTSVIAAGVMAVGVMTARGQDDPAPPAPPAPPAKPAPPAPPRPPADGDFDRRTAEAFKRQIEQAQRQVAQAERAVDEARRKADEDRRQAESRDRAFQLMFNPHAPMEYRAPTAWWGTVNDWSRMSNDPTSMAVAAVVQASDLLKARGADAEVKYFEDLLPQVTNETVKRAVRLQLIDAYKRARNTEKALDELEKLITAAPAATRGDGRRPRTSAAVGGGASGRE